LILRLVPTLQLLEHLVGLFVQPPVSMLKMSIAGTWVQMMSVSTMASAPRLFE